MSCGVVGAALAGPHANADAVIALHMTGKVKAIGCTGTSPVQGALTVLPANYVVNFATPLDNSNLNYVWLMIANADEATGIAGASCGINWNADPFGPTSIEDNGMTLTWTLCADLAFPSMTPTWPDPQSGNRVTWAPQTNCQRRQPAAGKVTALAGFFVAYSYYAVAAFVEVIPHPAVDPPELAIADCNATETRLDFSHRGWVGWNNGPCPGPGCVVPGCNPYLGPCEPPVPVRPTTWGRIKSLGTGE
jgi:hypothetical protein